MKPKSSKTVPERGSTVSIKSHYTEEDSMSKAALAQRVESMERQLKVMKNIANNLDRLESTEEAERVIGSIAVMYGLAQARFPEDVESI
jgi:hypothetical protein